MAFKNFFIHCKTVDDARKRYRKLVFELHPDSSGYDSTADFQAMQAEFEAWKPSGKEKFTGEWAEWTGGGCSDFVRIVDELVKLDGLIIEITGSFIWVSGETKTHKDAIRGIDPGSTFRPAKWAHRHSKWYFSPLSYKKRTKKKFSFDEISRMWGYERATGGSSRDDKDSIQGKIF